MRTCVFLTCEQHADALPDDYYLIEPLSQSGWSVQELSWSLPHADWSQYDCVILRSTWDYTERLGEFLQVIDRIAGATTLWNPKEVVYWNCRKSYLADLEKKGVTIVPSSFDSSPEELAHHFGAFGARQIVLKPIVGANSRSILVLSSSDVLENSNEKLLSSKILKQGEFFVQPFIVDIVRRGEISLIFFDREFSHAVNKIPASNDFRTQESYGATINAYQPSLAEIKVAAQILEKVEAPLLYARVDLVYLPSGSLALMELELIEPSLFLKWAPLSARQKFSNALESLLKK